MGLAWCVSTFVVTVLKWVSMSGVMSLSGTPRADAIIFWRLPRWSIAAAAITPWLSASAFMCFTLPLVINLNYRSNANRAANRVQTPEIRLGAAHIAQDLSFQSSGIFELAFRADPAQEFDMNLPGRLTLDGREQESLHGRLVAVEGGPYADGGDGGPLARGFQIAG